MRPDQQSERSAASTNAGAASRMGRRACLGGLAMGGAATLLGAALPGTAEARSGPVMSLKEQRRRHVIVQEFDISCGAAALCTILNYQHGDSVTEREIALGLIAREEYIERPELIRIRQGFSLLDLKRFADGRGYEGIGFGQLVYENLLENAPIILPVDINGYRHFVVFRGEMFDTVLLADPAYGNRTMTRARFERVWLEFPELGRVGFVVRRRDGLIPPNRLEPRPSDFLVVQ